MTVFQFQSGEVSLPTRRSEDPHLHTWNPQRLTPTNADGRTGDRGRREVDPILR